MDLNNDLLDERGANAIQYDAILYDNEDAESRSQAESHQCQFQCKSDFEVPDCRQAVQMSHYLYLGDGPKFDMLTTIEDKFSYLPAH